MKIVTKILSEIKPMTKQEADHLREIYKNDDDIDFSDIPELDDEILATGKVVSPSKIAPPVSLSVQ